MISIPYVQTLSQYNKWQNGSIFAAAETLDDKARKVDRGAFFGSIHKTLNHLYWADSMWMNRFTPEIPPPKQPGANSVAEFDDWPSLYIARRTLDDAILLWSKGLDQTVFDGEISWYSGSLQTEVRKSVDLCLVSFFNHQTHHRGQVHAMLTAAGAKPDDTDLLLMPESV